MPEALSASQSLCSGSVRPALQNITTGLRYLREAVVSSEGEHVAGPAAPALGCPSPHSALQAGAPVGGERATVGSELQV